MFLWPKGPVHYGWIVVAITFLTVLVTAGVRSAPAVFIHPLEAQFGWTRTSIAAAVSISLLLYGLAGPISGALIDRFGARVVMLGSLAFLALGLVGLTGMTELWQLDLFWGVVVGLGAGGSASVLWASVATRWFVARRGLVLGLLGSATSTGQLIFLPMLMATIVGFGWRGAVLLMLAIVLVLMVPVVRWMRNDPSEVGLSPYGAAAHEIKGAALAQEAAVPLSQAVRAPEFWLLAGAFFTCGATANGLVGTHLIPHSIDHGIPEVAAAATVGVMGGMNFLGTLLSGWLTDRVDPRKLLASVYVLRGLSLFVLPFVTDFSGLMVFAVIYGLDWFATVPPTVTLAVRRFGKRSIATIYGWIFASHQIGAALSAAMGGVVYDALGDYQFAFLAGGVIALIGAGMALLIRSQRAAPVMVPTSPAPA